MFRVAGVDPGNIEIGFRGRQYVPISIPAAVNSYTQHLGVKSDGPRFIVAAFQTDKKDNQETILHFLITVKRQE